MVYFLCFQPLSSLSLPLHWLISIHSTRDPVLDPIWKFYLCRAASCSAYWASSLLYLQACKCVFRYHSSEIAPSKRAPAVGEAPDHTLTLTPTSKLREGPRDVHQIEHTMMLICGMLRSMGWEEGGGTETVGEEEAKKKMLCGVFVRQTRRSLRSALKRLHKGLEHRQRKCVLRNLDCLLFEDLKNNNM